MRIIYTKKSTLNFLGIKIFSFTTDYSERSSEKNDDFNDEMIALKEKTIKIRE